MKFLKNLFLAISTIFTVLLGSIQIYDYYFDNKIEVILLESSKIYYNNEIPYYKTIFKLNNKSNINIINEKLVLSLENKKVTIYKYFYTNSRNKSKIELKIEKNYIDIFLKKLKPDESVNITILTDTFLDKSMINLDLSKLGNKDFFNQNIINENSYYEYYIISAFLFCIFMLFYIFHLKNNTKVENEKWINKYMEQEEKKEEVQGYLDECIDKYNILELEKDELKNEYTELLKLKVQELKEG